jgi:alkylation response protein AidB-like acyl-CoA dehydrogenase
MTAVSGSAVVAAGSIEEFRAMVRVWLADHAFELPADLSLRFARLRQWQRELFEAGLMGLAWPTEFGGRGLSPAHQKVFFDELAAARLPPPAALVGVEVVGPTLLELGTEEQRSRYLSALLRGDEIWCQGFSEPEAGSDLAGLQTRAVRDGDTYVVNGQKVWTSWAQFSQWCAVLVRTDPQALSHKGITCLLVDMSTAGLTVRPITQITGEDEFSELFFDDVRVPAANVLGTVGGGWDVAMKVLANERGSFAMRRNAEVGAAFQEALAALRATDKPLDDTDAAAIGVALIALQVMDSQTRRTVQRLIDRVGPSPLDSVDKLVITELEQRVHSSLRALLGADAMQPAARPLDLDAGQWTREYLYSRAATIYGGTAQIQRNIVAQRLLGLPRS